MNKKGSTLVMTIYLVMILSVLTLSLLTIMVTDSKQVVQQDDQMQTYYIARAGLDAVAEYLINNPLDIALYNGATSSPNTGVGGGSVVVNVNLQPSGGILLSATATVEARSKTVSLELDRISLEHAIFSMSNLDVTSMDEVYGDLGSNGWVHDAGTDGRTGYTNYEYMDLVIHTQVFPTLATEPDINENSSYTYNLGSRYIGDIRFNLPSGSVTFDTTLGDIHIVTDDFYLKGEIDIIGGNRVFFYINDTANIQTPALNTNDPDDLIFYLAKDAVMSLKTPVGFNGRIIGPEAIVSMSANSSLTGSVIAESFYGTSNANIYFDAPDSKDLVTGYKRGTWK